MVIAISIFLAVAVLIVPMVLYSMKNYRILRAKLDKSFSDWRTVKEVKRKIMLTSVMMAFRRWE